MTAETPGQRVGRGAAVTGRIFGPTHEPWPERRHAFPGGVTGLPDLAYTTIPGYRPLLLDLYLPPAGGGGRPLVVYVHGGGWMGGGRRLSAAFANWPAVLASVAAEGFVVASVSYRLSGEARFPAAIHDVRTAIRWLRASAARFGIDGARVGLWGASAGGQLAALAATTAGTAALAPPLLTPSPNPNVEQPVTPPPDLAKQRDDVQAVAAWYGVFDFTTLRRAEPDAPENRYLDTGEEAMLRLASPAFHVRPGLPPFLLIHGAADRTVPMDQSTSLHARLGAAGVTAELVVLPDIDHSFIGGDVQQTQQTSRAMLARTVDFLHCVLATERR